MSKVTLPSNLQAPIQALVRPSQWLPCLRGLHSYREKWLLESSVTSADLCQAVVSAVNKMIQQGYNNESFDIHKVEEEEGFVRVFAFTRAEWLDVIEIHYCREGLGEAYSFSSGLVPLCIPLACLCNIMCCCAPFLDSNFNKNRLESLRSAMPIRVLLAEDDS